MRLPSGTDPLRGDVAIAGALLALGQLEAVIGTASPPRWHQALLTLVWTLPLVLRRRWPVPVLAVLMVTGPTIELVNAEGGVSSYVLAAMLAAYTVGRELDPPTSWWGPALTVLLPWTWFTLTTGQLSDFIFVALLYGGAWAVGDLLRRSATDVEELTTRSQDLQVRAAEREQQAVAEERARIARELHDVVSHSITAITVQTQAARRRLGEDHSEADTLAMVEGTARQAMAEMRRLLGVLRASDDALALSPQPGLDQLRALVEEARSTGTHVRLDVHGAAVTLPPGLDLAAFRVVQEALTNARKHAPAAAVRVVLTYGTGTLDVLIEDDGDGPEPVSLASGPGHGLVGMRERVQLYRGTLTTGRRPDGGFGVRATLPLVTPPA